MSILAIALSQHIRREATNKEIIRYINKTYPTRKPSFEEIKQDSYLQQFITNDKPIKKKSFFCRGWFPKI